MDKGFTRTGRRSKYGTAANSGSDDGKLINGGSEIVKSEDEDPLKMTLDIKTEPQDDVLNDELSSDEKGTDSPSDSMEFHGFDGPSTPIAATVMKKLVVKYEADLKIEDATRAKGKDEEYLETASEIKLRGQDIYTDSEDENAKPTQEMKHVNIVPKKRPLAQLTEEFNDDDKSISPPPLKRARKKSVKAREAAGDTVGDDQAGKDTIAEVTSSADVSLKGKGHKGESHPEVTSSGVQGSSRKVTRPDINSALILKPFELGWKRELVYRATGPKGSDKKSGDIYYYTPQGKKVRSRVEIEQHLKGSGLTKDNFTFLKEALGLNDPSKEIIRDAFRKSSESPVPTKKEKAVKLSKQKAAAGSSISAESPSVLKESSSAPSSGTNGTSTSPSATTPSSKAAGTPRVVLKTPKQSPKPGPKPKVTTPRKASVESPPTKLKGTRSKKENAQSDGELEVGMLPPSWEPGDQPLSERNTVNNTAGAWKSKTSVLTATTTPCSISCVGAQGTTGVSPTLQCRVCLCLYHPECVQLSPSPDTALNYVCKNCLVGPKEKIAQGNALSRLPVPPHRPRAPIPRPPTSSASPASSLVGGVTTWLPPSSTVEVRPPAPPIAGPSTAEVPAPPQTVANIGGQKFIVVPKHNVLSVSPAAATTSPSPATASPLHHAAPPGIYLVPYSTSGSDCISPSSFLNGVASHSPDISETHEPKRGRPSDNPESAVESTSSGLPKPQPHRSMDNFISDLSFGYVALFHVMGYLKVQELLRASRVCRMWRDLSLHPNLWRTVRMKNSQVCDWNGFAAALRVRGTRVLDLRKILLPGRPEDIELMWSEFCRVIGQADSLQRIELSRCPASVVEQLATSCSQLRVLNAIAIKSEEVDLEPIKNLPLLEELRLKSTNGMNITKTLDPLLSCRLRHLSLTSIKNLGSCNVNILSELQNLESLELGDCLKLGMDFGPDHLVKLTNLQRLRLEKGHVPGCPVISIIEAVSKLPALEQLEIINFDVKPGFDKALAQCKQLRRLLIIPTYITTSASTNHIVLCSIPLLADSLDYLVWGLTQELTKVTDLFIDQCEQRKGPSGALSRLNAFRGECIPIIRPVVEEAKETKIDDTSESNENLEPPTVKKEVNEDEKDTEKEVGEQEEIEVKGEKEKEEEEKEKATDKEESSGSDTDDVGSLARGFRALSVLQPSEDSTSPVTGPPVSILPIPQLHKLLQQLLPTTRVKILKVAFPSTWRQTFPELSSFQ